jgi:hypothetical protein
LIFEKSGVWNGSALGFANGLDAGSVAEAVAADALRGAASAGALVTKVSAAVARNIVRIMSLPEHVNYSPAVSSTGVVVTQA